MRLNIYIYIYHCGDTSVVGIIILSRSSLRKCVFLYIYTYIIFTAANTSAVGIIILSSEFPTNSPILILIYLYFIYCGNTSVASIMTVKEKGGGEKTCPVCIGFTHYSLIVV